MAETENEGTFRAASFEAIALPFAASLVRTARHITGEQSIAEDLVQETLLQAWRSFHQFESGTNCRAWLYRIMINLWSKVRSKQRRQLQVVPLHDVDPGRESAIHTHLQVRLAVGTLPEEQRVVLMLGVVEGFTCREIADMLSLPIGTVMSRLARGRMRLRATLGESDEAARKGTE